MDAQQFPAVPKGLLEALEQRFPERSPRAAETMDQLMVRAGHAEVLRFLRATFDAQNETILAPEGSDYVLSQG